MSDLTLSNPNFKQAITTIFEQQGMMKLIGAQLVDVQAGQVTIELPVTAAISQQHGFVHAAAVTAIVDTACGCAAATLMPPDSNVLTIEYKVNFLAPAAGVKLIAVGRVTKAGRTITVTTGDVWAVDAAGQQRPCATILATMMRR